MRFGYWGGSLVATLGVLVGATAHAQGLDALQITWSGPASCPAPPRVHAEVAELLGPSFRLSGPATAEVRVRAGEGRVLLQLDVRTVDGPGHRELELPGCAEAHKAAPVLIALSLNPELDAPPAAQAEPEPEPQPSPEPSPVEAARMTPEWGVGLRAGVDTATRSTLSPLLGLFGSWQRRWLRADADLLLVLPLRDDFASLGVELSSGVFAFGLGLCAGPHLGRLYLGACGGAELGTFWASSHGVAAPESDRALWAAGRLGGQLSYPLGRFLLQIDAWASLPMTRPELALDDLGVVHTTAPASLRVALGVQVYLGSVDPPASGQYYR